MSYGPDFADFYYQAGVYVSRLLKGQQPSDLPVQQPTKLELAINRRAPRSTQSVTRVNSRLVFATDTSSP